MASQKLFILLNCCKFLVFEPKMVMFKLSKSVSNVFAFMTKYVLNIFSVEDITTKHNATLFVIM